MDVTRKDVEAAVIELKSRGKPFSPSAVREAVGLECSGENIALVARHVLAIEADPDSVDIDTDDFGRSILEAFAAYDPAQWP